MRKILKLKSSQLHRAEAQNVLLRMGEATELLTLEKDGYGATKVENLKASVDTLISAMRKNRSTKALSEALTNSDTQNKRNVSLLIRTVTVNVLNANQSIALAAQSVLQAVTLNGDFFSGTREKRYARLDNIIDAIEKLGKEVLTNAGIFDFFENLKNGRQEFFKLWQERSNFKDTFVKAEIKTAVDDALKAYQELVECINGKIAGEGTDEGFVAFVNAANHIISEINTKISARSGNGLISNEEESMADC